METNQNTSVKNIPAGVMLNAYPDSIGDKLSDTVAMLKRPEFKDTFSLFYILPTFFNSDLDRGFSIIDYDICEELVSRQDIADLHDLNILLKFDLVLNHLSVASPQFKDMVKNGDDSKYTDFFINWNEFWDGCGEMQDEGYILPEKKYLDLLFMRKPGLPILKVRFPDGSDHPYWNTFYQKVTYTPITLEDLSGISGITPPQANDIIAIVNATIDEGQDIATLDLKENNAHKSAVVEIVEKHRHYLGQMDMNAKSEEVWAFYDETLHKLSDYGCRLLRLDAFAYLHKEVGEKNFFNKPGTWEYLERLRAIADKYELTLLPEIHSEHGSRMHNEIAEEGYLIYDFFLPGLLLHVLDKADKTPLVRWIDEIFEYDLKAVNMLGCHDGIPVLDLGDKNIDGKTSPGLLSREDIDSIIERVLDRGGRLKNLFDADGKKIAYYQVNATYFSALGEDEQKMLLARAIQMFMPGIPQVWYLDIFAGKNDHAAADRGGVADHKEINRTTLSMADIEEGLKKEVVIKQLDLIRMRNTSPAFLGKLFVADNTPPHILEMTWKNGSSSAQLKANLTTSSFEITQT